MPRPKPPFPPQPFPPVPPQPFPPVPPQPPIVPPPGYNTYVGMRYVPLICGKYDPQRAYEPLSVVAYGFQSFTSLTYVPAGITPENEQYWSLTGDYVAQFQVYKEELNQLEARMETIAGNETEQNNQIANLGKAMETATEAIQNNSERIVDVQKNVTALDAKVDENDNNQTAALNQAKADFASNLNTLTNTVNQNKEATDTAITNLAATMSADLTDAERDLTNLINSTAQQTKLDYQAADNILSGKIDDLQSDTNTKFADQNTKISANTSAIADTKNMVQTLETNTNANFTTVNQKITSAEQEIDALQSKDTAIDSEITLLKSGQADTNAAVSTLDSKISQEIVNRTNADTAMVTRINALETAVDDRDNDIDALKQSQQAQDVKISGLEEDVQINTQDIDGLKMDVAAVTSSVAQINASVMELDAEIPKINAVIATHTTQIGDLTSEVDTLEGELRTLDTQLDGIQDNVEALTANDNSQNTDISALKLETQRLDAFSKSLESSMNDNEERIMTLEGDYSTLHGQVHTNETDIAALETDVNNQTGEIAGLETNVTKINNQLTNFLYDNLVVSNFVNSVKVFNDIPVTKYGNTIWTPLEMPSPVTIQPYTFGVISLLLDNGSINLPTQKPPIFVTLHLIGNTDIHSINPGFIGRVYEFMSVPLASPHINHNIPTILLNIPYYNNANQSINVTAEIDITYRESEEQQNIGTAHCEFGLQAFQLHLHSVTPDN